MSLYGLLIHTLQKINTTLYQNLNTCVRVIKVEAVLITKIQMYKLF